MSYDASYNQPNATPNVAYNSLTYINFYLSPLDTSINVYKATIDDGVDLSDNLFNSVKAVAELMVDASYVRNVFQFATNSANLNGVSDEDMHFFVDANAFSNLPVNTASWSVNKQPGTTSGLLYQQIGKAFISGTKNSANNYDIDVTGAKYAVDNKGIIKDLFRDLANQLFKTQYAVDLFNNEIDMCNNTAASFAALFSPPVAPVISNIYSALNDASGLNVSDPVPKNIGKAIYNNIIYYDRSRLEDLSGNSSIYTSTISMNTTDNSIAGGSYGLNTQMRMYKMPLLAGDKLHFHINCIYDNDQSAVVDPNLILMPRMYEVVLNLE
jgi:hypothetical protein